MEDYYEIERTRAQALLLFNKKWTKHLKTQSRISSYHTTKRAQLDTIRIAKHLARIDDNRCDALKTVINNYRTLVDETYMHVNFGRRFEHCRFREFRKLFKDAHASVVKSEKSLDKLRDRVFRAEQSLLNANRAVEKVIHDESSNERKRFNKSDTQIKCENQLKQLKEKVAHAEQNLDNTKQTYRKRAKQIFAQCQQVEEQRLEQIREILLMFTQTIHLQKYAPEIEQVYEELISNISTQQNSLEDLAFWAKMYGIEEDESAAISLSKVESQTTVKNASGELRSSRASVIANNSTIDNEQEQSKDREELLAAKIS
ncbi:unnamed protein product [Rotaria sp. Silwood2]|nr:unnamed protein product [Rotaria sp. Silwood2]CAF4143183.1 unnamed protein product [Rotaria sp. Silwood2]